MRAPCNHGRPNLLQPRTMGRLFEFVRRNRRDSAGRAPTRKRTRGNPESRL